MFKTFEEMVEQAKSTAPKVLSVAAAEDPEVLKAVKKAEEDGLITPILVGDKEKIEVFAKEVYYDLSNIKIYDEPDVTKASHKAVQIVAEGEADFLMKGLVGTATILRALLTKEYGLRQDRLLSHIALMDLEDLDRLIIMTDGGMNMYPDLNQKKQIIENAVEVMHSIGVEMPKVVPLAALELVNPDMEPTIHAAILSKMADRGQIKGCIIDGPLAFDNAISEEAAKHKGIKSPVAGKADVLLVPNIETGNVMYKALSYFSKMRAAMLVVGAKVPVVVTSRADNYMTKYYSMALGKLMMEYKNQ
ncbi:phosphate butyryltransferase [Anoxybacter fermentans]|uniref:Phosphate butyryltransferase n=1 Tax=Anoxybacter fermentans TaxID=1323375 RepID=A0A3Q9HQX9_9FIRM|nr:phosphate butyryltransferase [Anoxybacter fermentans]AZR73446.1 phosphate butyryltransferase [Anoxybacter fermentans]